jgi:aurora kinase
MEDEVRKIMRDILSGVAYIHALKPAIIHRDIKPENILICGNTLKIADFGWSGIHNKVRNTYCGTPDYLSPEMILGTGHNEKLDIWCCGILTYELFHGKTPFTPNVVENS